MRGPTTVAWKAAQRADKWVSMTADSKAEHLAVAKAASKDNQRAVNLVDPMVETKAPQTVDLTAVQTAAVKAFRLAGSMVANWAAKMAGPLALSMVDSRVEH